VELAAECSADDGQDVGCQGNITASAIKSAEAAYIE
jgi:hypothetical protein